MNRPLSKSRPALALLALLSVGCSPAGAPAPAPAPPAGVASAPALRIAYTAIADSIADDPTVDALVAPFRDRMTTQIQQVIGEAAVPLTEAKPEGTLGNFSADAMLWAARREVDGPVHMAMTNNGGLRVPIAQGPIRVEQMFELMPFENMLSVLTLSGSQVIQVADQLAAMRGEPIAGFTFRIEATANGAVARDLLVGGEPVDPAAEYRIVTNDYLASGGGSITPFHEPLGRLDLPVLLRDAFIDYVREMKVIRPEIEGRITGGSDR